MAKRTGDAM